MKYLNYFLIIFFVFFFTNSHATNKVVFIDIDYLINNSSIGKKIINKLENEDKKNVDILKKKEKLLKKNEEEIKKKQNIISSEELQKEINLLKKKISEFKSEKNKMVNLFSKLKNDEFDIAILIVVSPDKHCSSFSLPSHNFAGFKLYFPDFNP